MRIVPLSVFAAREGADLSHGDLLYCYLRDRAHRGLMAVDSATTAGSQPQARSTAEDGRARVSCRARNARSAGEESRRPAVAGSRPASGRERIASLDPPAHAAEERRSPAVKDGLGSGFPADDDVATRGRASRLSPVAGCPGNGDGEPVQSAARILPAAVACLCRSASTSSENRSDGRTTYSSSRRNMM